MSVLEVEDISVSFGSVVGRVTVLNGVSLALEKGEVLALVGESGSGKSVTAAAIMDLVPSPPGSVDSGSIRLDGKELLGLPQPERRALYGRCISLIFQDALAALNPVYTVGWQIAETFRIHGLASGAEADTRAVELMRAVGIPDPAARAKLYPHQFSGGMRQRVMIAMAIALDPLVIIADEPTTALDVTVQAQIVELLQEARRRTGAGMIFISHDLGVVAELADRVAVMYAGRIVETAGIDDFFADPLHPYSRGLLASQPGLEDTIEELVPIPGSAPNPANLPSGCAFRTRCPIAAPVCASEVPALRPLLPGRQVACHFAGAAR